MLVYILKFSACLAIFLAFYKLFLERENMHQFKRFYLLGMVLISMVIPFITITEYIEAQPIVDSFNSMASLSSETVSTTVESPINYLPIVLWCIYCIGVLLFGLKFGINLTEMILRIKRNPKLKNSTFINVLLQDLVSPHTFFNYIFLNKHKYETHQIPEEVLLHEQTHAKQKHSLDILFIELLHTVFWFIPLIHFIKNSIKLNHEFLADKAVLNKGIETSNYQQVLFAFSTNDKDIQLANAINYSSIKKRITVMKTHTSKQKIWLRSLVLLPLLALTLYSFSERVEVAKEKAKSEATQGNNNELPIEMASQRMTDEQDGATREQMKEYERLAKHYNSLPDNKRYIKQKDIERMEYIYSLMSAKQKKDTEPFPVIAPPPPPPAPEAQEPKDLKANEVERMLPPPPPPPIPENATNEQKEQYKKVIKEYKIKYAIKDGKVYENPPPPPIPENATEPQKKKYEEAIRLYKLRTQENELARVKEVKEEKLAYKEAREAKIKTEKKELAEVRELREKEDVQKLKNEKLAYAEAQRAKVSRGERLARPKEIKTPEPPQAPLDHVIEMAKKGAVFYLEGKEVSSDKAIEALKENKALNIKISDSNTKQPKVHITKKPIVIDN